MPSLKKYHILLALTSSLIALQAQPYNPSFFNCMKWRCIGPFRGGRTIGACGVIGHPNVFYMGVNDGGVWKTDDYGRTWQPLFDSEPTGSIGDVEVAPSNPNVIYVGSGEGVQRPDLSVGDGIYKSTDGGKTWMHLGLTDAYQIGGLAVDPKNENRVFVAALGHPYGPNEERGVYRTTDGGNTWQKVFYIDENTGAIQVTIDPVNTDIVYADMFEVRKGPWENGDFTGPNSGLFKSTDGGNTWKKLEKGLPGKAEGLGRIGFCIAPSTPNRLYAVVSSKKGGGIYRSDDGGESWTLQNNDLKYWDRGDDFAEMKVDPKNPDVVYDINVVSWKSTDGGKTWTGWKGAPGGDDYHRLWINPDNPDIILLAGDQGAAVTVNGGRTWSSWYNQPTAQLYHVSADNAFPYNVYSGQQESGSVCIASRGNDGQITDRDWHPVSAEEYGYVVADPLNPTIVYGGKISKYNKLTGQAQDISPDCHDGKYRFIRTAPIVFSPVDHKTLYFAGNVVFKTTDGGNSWDVISPDLTRTSYNIPSSVGIYANDMMKHMKPRGVVYTIAPSPLDENLIWAGSDDGLIHVTRNGGSTWEDVTPPSITDWDKISMLEASHTDINTAYAAVNCIRLNDEHPHIYRTKDGGKTWKEIVNGLPEEPINSVKEDPVRKGLLFAGSENAVYVSFDDGDHWQSLRLNMPASSIRDLVIKDNDLVVATHGRSFWILDDITPLRQLSKNSVKDAVTLYQPEPAYRVRWDMWPDTPLPADEPAGKNPPDGAIIDYYLKENSHDTVKLDLFDSAGTLVRHYTSKDSLYKIPDVNIPLYWIRPQQILSADSGSHRFLWDMHYTPLNVPPSYPISAIVGNTAPAPTSPWVMPGTYTVKLTVNGKVYTKPLIIKMDPRVKASTGDLLEQHDYSMICYHDRQKALVLLNNIHSLQTQLKVVVDKIPQGNYTDLRDNIDTCYFKLGMLNHLLTDGIPQGRASLNDELGGLFGTMEGVDTRPTNQCIAETTEENAKFEEVWGKWILLQQDLKELNTQLKTSGLEEMKWE